MKTNAILVGAALALAACATPNPTNDRLAARHVRPGVSTRADVDQLLGKPFNTFAVKSTKGTESTYGYTDMWGYAMELVVTYDEKGIVVARYAERQER
jgi:hypothetical protein